MTYPAALEPSNGAPTKLGLYAGKSSLIEANQGASTAAPVRAGDLWGSANILVCGFTELSSSVFPCRPVLHPVLACPRNW